MIEKNTKYLDKALEYTNESAIRDAYYLATESMGTLNMNASGLMNKHKCHGATDITGFGIKGHADNLVQVQKADVNFRIDKLPIIKGMDQINNNVLDFKLMTGFSAETSGGLFLMVPPERLEAF